MTASHRTLSSRRPTGGRRAAGFTLIELLVVMGIIVLIAAAAIPAFRFITGSRSVEGAQNLVNAMVGRARTQAIVTGQNAGVFFFVDPRDDRSKMALVQQSGGTATQYSGWAITDTGQQTNDLVTYYDQSKPDILPSGTLQLASTLNSGLTQKDAFVTSTNSYQRLAVLSVQCAQAHTPKSAGGANDGQIGTVSPYANQYWNSSIGSLELVRDTDPQMLPQGVAAVVVIDPLDQTTWASLPGARNLGVDRYVRTGCIMFDGQGRFTSTPFDVFSTSKLGQTLFLNFMPNGGASTTPVSLSGNGALPLFTGFGAVLFDRQALLADAKINGYTEGDYLYGNTATGAYFMPYNGSPAPQQGVGAPAATTAAAEILKQQWLDNNGLLLTATRYNGAMTRGE